MAEELGISIGMINKILLYLKSEQIIETKTTNKYTEISVLNWNEYQGGEHKSEHKVNAKRTQSETNKNVKNDKNVKNKEEHIKKPNRILLSRFQMMAFLKEFPGLTTSELKEQVEKCNNYMAISSIEYTNPNLFLKGWLKRYMTEKKKEEIEKERNNRFEKALPLLTERQIKENKERLEKIKKEMMGKGVIF